MPISLTEGYFENPRYRFSEEPKKKRVFPCEDKKTTQILP